MTWRWHILLGKWCYSGRLTWKWNSSRPWAWTVVAFNWPLPDMCHVPGIQARLSLLIWNSWTCCGSLSFDQLVYDVLSKLGDHLLLLILIWNALQLELLVTTSWIWNRLFELEGGLRHERRHWGVESAVDSAIAHFHSSVLVTSLQWARIVSELLILLQGEWLLLLNAELIDSVYVNHGGVRMRMH